MTLRQRLRDNARDEQGVSLIMAIGFVFAIGILVSAIATFATNAFITSYNLGHQRGVEANAESAATIAIDYERQIYDHTALAATPSNPANCMPPGNQIYPTNPSIPAHMTVFCAPLSVNPGTAASRVMEFTVCPVSTSAMTPPASCGQTDLYTTVIFDDLPPRSGPAADTCPTISTPLNTCGIAMTVQSWDVRTADN
jgi:hypothetical protein